MDELQLRIECAERDVATANERLRIAQSLRRIAVHAGQPGSRFKVSLAAAQHELDEAEVRLRALYEGKGDWVPLAHTASTAVTPAPVAGR